MTFLERLGFRRIGEFWTDGVVFLPDRRIGFLRKLGLLWHYMTRDSLTQAERVSALRRSIRGIQMLTPNEKGRARFLANEEPEHADR